MAATDLPLHKRSRFGRLMRATLDPALDWVFYRFDLNGPNGRPDHGKVLSTFAFFWGITVLTLAGPIVAELCRAGAAGCGLALSMYLAFAALVFGMAFGAQGFRIWAKYRAGGTADALSETATATVRAQADVAIAEIQQRRAAGGDYEATP